MASSGVVRAAPFVSIEFVVSNWNVFGITAWTTTPDALPGPRFVTWISKFGGVVPGVYAPFSQSARSTTASCATSLLQAVAISAMGASTESATAIASRELKIRTRLQRETIRPWLRCEAAPAGGADGKP